MTLVGAACAETASNGARTAPRTRISPQALAAAKVPLTGELRSKWQAMKGVAIWITNYVITVSRASRSAMSLKLAPADASLNVTEQVSDGVSRVYFGKMGADGKTFMAHAHFTVDSARVRPKKYPKPVALKAELSSRALAVLTIKADYERVNGKGMLNKLGDKGIQMAHCVRRLQDGKIAAFLIAIPAHARLAIVGTGQVWVLSKDGAKVLHTERLHRSTQVHLLAKHAKEKTISARHHHSKTEGDLPTPTDLFAVAASPILQRLEVIGPRFVVVIDKTADGNIRLSPLYDRKKYLRLTR